MRAHLRQVGDMKFRARVDDGPEVLMDADGKGPTREAPTPFQLALLAAMGCTASDVVWILRKRREPLTSVEVEADAERAPQEPKVLTRVRLHFRVRGDGLREAAVKRAIDLSTEKYCSVGIMLKRGGVAWETTYEVLPSA